MVNNKKVNEKLIMNIRSILFIIWVIVILSFLIVNYVPSVKAAVILATTIKPETFTELYFEDHLSLPNKVALFKENNFKFVIHNLENKDMEYPYEVYIDLSGEKLIIDKGSVLLKINEYKTITENFAITILINELFQLQRLKIIVNLVNKNQQIHFWIGEE